MLLDEFAPWRWLLIRDNQGTVRSLVNVIVLSQALRNHGETMKQGNHGGTSVDAFHK
jgi:hypothetical protein